MNPFLTGIILAIIFVFVTLIAVLSRYKRCPSDQIMVVYGKVAGAHAAKCIHGGAAFIWPLFQDYSFLGLTPMTIDINLKSALSSQNIRVDIPSRFTIGISTEPEIMAVAAERLLSMHTEQIEENAKDIIFGQLRATIATMSIEEINAEREKFEEAVMMNVESELSKIGLKLINVNITDIADESGYIVALGKKAAAEAINKAKIEVAQQERDGETGQAIANKEQRINVANANAEAVRGENESKVVIANSDADRREKEAEAERKAVAAEKSKSAMADREAYLAQKEAEDARAAREKSTQVADIIVPAEIDKQKKIIQAEAAKEQQRLYGQGEGAKVMESMKGEALGLLEMLQKKGAGLAEIVKAAGNDADKAAMLLIVEQLPEIVKAQATAISNIDFEKVVVWDGAGGGSGDGSSATANWLSSFTKMLPGMHDVCDMAGVTLPAFLGVLNEQAEKMKKNEEKSGGPGGPA